MGLKGMGLFYVFLCLISCSPNQVKFFDQMSFVPLDIQRDTELSGRSYLDKNQYLVKVVSEPQNNLIHDFSLLVDDNARIKHFLRTSIKTESSYSFEQLDNREVVLATASNRDVLFLKCHNCTKDKGGTLVFRYLANGILGKYKEFPIVLRPDKKMRWKLYTVGQRGKPGIYIHTLTLRSRKLAGTVIGIRKIVVN